jgi:ribosome-binding factor A
MQPAGKPVFFIAQNHVFMDSQRQSKISRLIQKELADIFQKHMNTLFNGGMISVTVVRVTPDLSLAKVYVSLFPPERKKELFELVNIQTKTIRHELGRRTRNQLRQIPELKFFIDDSIDYARKIDDLLNS